MQGNKLDEISLERGKKKRDEASTEIYFFSAILRLVSLFFNETKMLSVRIRKMYVKTKMAKT